MKLQEEGAEILVLSFSFCAICCRRSLTLGGGVVDEGWGFNCTSVEMGK